MNKNKMILVGGVAGGFCVGAIVGGIVTIKMTIKTIEKALYGICSECGLTVRKEGRCYVIDSATPVESSEE